MNLISVPLLRTQAPSVGVGEEDQEDFPADLTLHSDPPTPEGLECTTANAVEVHRDSQPGEENLLMGWMKPPTTFPITSHIFEEVHVSYTVAYSTAQQQSFIYWAAIAML